MKAKQTSSAGGVASVVGRVAIAFCLGLLFTAVCIALLSWSESYLAQDTVRLLTRVIWWPVAITCGLSPRDFLCALPGIVFGFLFHWLVAYVLLWWRNRSRTRVGYATPPLN